MKRSYVRGGSPLCSKCRNPKERPGSRYCRACHAAYVRERGYNLYRNLSPEAQERAKARSMAKVYRKRGKIAQQPCVACGAADSQMHHPDYSKPLEVVWLCRPCHMREHQEAA